MSLLNNKSNSQLISDDINGFSNEDSSKLLQKKKSSKKKKRNKINKQKGNWSTEED